jgi:hypothetical protein
VVLPVPPFWERTAIVAPKGAKGYSAVSGAAGACAPSVERSAKRSR